MLPLSDMGGPRLTGLVLSLVLVSLTGCAARGIPADRGVELTLARAPAAAELPGRFKVVTFNVHMEPGAKVAAAIARDRALRDADVIVLQEVRRSDASCSGACEIGRALGYHVMYAPGHAVPEGDDGVAILSRAPLTSAEVLELPYFDVVFNAGRRVALVATVQHAGRPITVYAVHLDNRLGPGDRRKQMLPVLEHAQRQPTPVILAGDFNTSPFSWLGHVIPIPTGTQTRRFEKLVRAHGFDTPVTDSGPTHRYLGMRLDAIYTRGFQTYRFATSNADHVSDHVALWALVEPDLQQTRVVAK
jgi:endonuclease/exonuclease/phosphatase family metal-dependent hydrolase